MTKYYKTDRIDDNTENKNNKKENEISSAKLEIHALVGSTDWSNHGDPLTGLIQTGAYFWIFTSNQDEYWPDFHVGST